MAIANRAMKGVSIAALAAICAIIGVILFLTFYWLFQILSPASAAFGTGILALVVALGCYFVHATTSERQVTFGMMGGFGLLGIVLLYFSIFISDSGSKVAGFFGVSILILIVLALVWWGARASAEEAERKARRKTECVKKG